jgi:hypothetical protein
MEETTSKSTIETPQQASAKVVNTDFFLADSVTAPPDGQIPWAFIEIENPTEVAHGSVRTELRLYDSNNALLEARKGYTDYIPASTVWRDYFRYYTETPDRVDHVMARIVDNDPVVNGAEIEEATVVSSEMTVSAESGVDLAAEIDFNGVTPDRVTVIGLFYDAEGRLRGTVRHVATNPAETVAVSAESLIRTPPNLNDQQATSHELVVLEGNI